MNSEIKTTENQSPQPGPATDRFHPLLAAAARRIKCAIVEHCATGADIDAVAAGIARDLLGEIVQQAFYQYEGCAYGPDDWRRLPPALRAAIVKATGAKA